MFALGCFLNPKELALGIRQFDQCTGIYQVQIMKFCFDLAVKRSDLLKFDFKRCNKNSFYLTQIMLIRFCLNNCFVIKVLCFVCKTEPSTPYAGNFHHIKLRYLRSRGRPPSGVELRNFTANEAKLIQTLFKFINDQMITFSTFRIYHISGET